MTRVAVIGTGAISASHIEGFLRFPRRSRIVALVDIDSERARAAAATHNLEDVEIVRDYRELLSRSGRGDKPRIDLVSICLPPSLHAEVAVEFLCAGVHVLVEKPMAPSLHECDRMLAAAQTSGKALSVVAQNRFSKPMVRLKRIVDSGLLGRILFRRVDSLWWRGGNYYDLAWRGTWASEGGGPTLNHAVHHMDLLLWMSGVPVSVSATMANTAHDNAEVEDISIAALWYSDGTLAQITSSVVHHGEQQQLEYQGERAMVAIPWRVHASHARENGFPEKNDELEKRLHALYSDGPELPFEGHTAQIEDMLSAIETGRTPLVDGEAGRRTMELITAIYKAAVNGSPVRLPLATNDPFYTKEEMLKHVPRFHEKTRVVDRFATNSITLGRDYSEPADVSRGNRAGGA